MLAFMGRLSTSMPFRSFAALAAASGLTKIMSATPRLDPFWLYLMSTRLTGPTDFWKYSYARSWISMAEASRIPEILNRLSKREPRRFRASATSTTRPAGAPARSQRALVVSKSGRRWPRLWIPAECPILDTSSPRAKLLHTSKHSWRAPRFKFLIPSKHPSNAVRNGHVFHSNKQTRHGVPVLLLASSPSKARGQCGDGT
jgi:hypothetical protein